MTTAQTLHDSPPSTRAGVLSWRLRPVFSGAAAPGTRAVTRVESSVSRCSQTSCDAASTAAKIDWLNATFDKPAMSLAGLIKFINELLNGSVSTVLDGGL